jgi:hypothetical protein
VRTARNATPHVSVTVKRSVDVNPDVAKRVILTQDRQVDLHTVDLHRVDPHKADHLPIDTLDIKR